MKIGFFALGIILLFLLPTVHSESAQEELEKLVNSTDVSDVTIEDVLKEGQNIFNRIKEDPLLMILLILILLVVGALILKKLRYHVTVHGEKITFIATLLSAAVLGALLLIDYLGRSKDVNLFLKPVIEPIAIMFILSLGSYLLIKVFPKKR